MIICQKVVVLLSTYNGSKFLEQQLDSLLSQSYEDFTIYIRDDGSADGTEDIIEKYMSESRKIFLLKDNENLGAAGSFLTLLNQVEADYYFFCDQDDVWLPNKIQVTLSEFIGKDAAMPILVHSDLEIVDESLSVLSDSFYKYSNIKVSDFNNRKQILLQNYIVGCTCCINKSLALLVRLTHDEFHHIAMHDWWFALNAKYFGEILFIDKPTIKYRQHSSNTLGANKDTLIRYLKLFFSGVGVTRVNKFREKIFRQAVFFSSKHNVKFTPKDKENFKYFHLLSKDKKISDILFFVFIKKHSFKSFRRNMAFVFSSFFYK